MIATPVVEHRIKVEANQNLHLIGSPLHVWHVACRVQGPGRWVCMGRASDGGRWLWTNVTWRAGDVDARGVEAIR